jgi:hypothetical protein
MLQHKNFPREGTLGEQIEFVLEYAVRAPSTHNTQPWLFRIEGSSLFLFPDWSRKLPEGDKDGRDFFISLGGCLEHIVTALRYFQMYIDVAIVGEVAPLSNDHIAKISIQPSRGTDPSLLPLVVAIEGRWNARGPFLSKPVPNDVLKHVGTMHEGDVRAVFSVEGESINHLAMLTGEGMREAHKKPAFRRELSRWMISNYSNKKEGIPGYSMLAPNLLSVVLPWIVGTFNMGPVLATLNKKSITSASGVGVIFSTKDSTSAWLNTGRLFQRISLYLNAEGIRTSIFVASIETPHLRLQLGEKYPQQGLPQFTFAFGYPKITPGQSPRHAPRARMV